MVFFDVMEGWVLLTFSAVDGAIVPTSGCLYRCRRGRWGALLLCGGLVLFFGVGLTCAFPVFLILMLWAFWSAEV
jgi:hypothetical protein